MEKRVLKFEYDIGTSSRTTSGQTNEEV
ncbi:unnamed protein product, partial [Adineta steineri]